MMTSSNGNIFRVTGLLRGEFTGPGEFPAQRPVTRSFDVFFDLRTNKRLGKQWWGWWFETPSNPLWRHCNKIRYHDISFGEFARCCEPPTQVYRFVKPHYLPDVSTKTSYSLLVTFSPVFPWMKIYVLRLINWQRSPQFIGNTQYIGIFQNMHRSSTPSCKVSNIFIIFLLTYNIRCSRQESSRVFQTNCQPYNHAGVSRHDGKGAADYVILPSHMFSNCSNWSVSLM